MTAISFLDGVAALATCYDGFILDLWGVLHDGHRPYPGVLDCLDRLRRAGRRVCLLSNAPKRSEVVARRLGEIGIGPDRYDHLHTSGEATWEHLAGRPDDWHRVLGRRLYHLAPEGDDSVYRGLDYDRVATPEDADFVIATEIFGGTLAQHEEMLRRSAARRLPMLCANPDLVVNAGSDIVICAGTLAARYAELGGEVRYHGKPHAEVFRRCFDILGIDDRRRIVMVGDGLATDIAGAAAAGIDAAFVTGGIHRHETTAPGADKPDRERLLRLCARAGATPTYVVPALAW